MSNWCVVQSDNRDKNSLGTMADLMEKNKKTCENLEGCSYIGDPLEGTDDVSPYWRKVHAVKKCIENEKCGTCLYLDSDAVIVPKNFKKDDIDSLLGGKEMGFAPAWGRDRLNAGVFAVKGNEIGKKIVNEWINLESKNWKKDKKNNWVCKQNLIDCPWAGKDYEQGTFIKEVAPKFEQHLNEASSYVWDNDSNKNCNGKVKHFMGRRNTKQTHISGYLKQHCG